jgi:hypothetical protein
MTLEDWSYVATIAQVPLIVISLAFIWRQVRQATELARAEHAQAIVTHASAFNLALAENEDLARLWRNRGRGRGDDVELDAARYRELLVQWLILHEVLFAQKSKGLIDEDLYAAWGTDLAFTLAHHNTALVASDLTHLFPGKFGAHMKKLLADASAKGKGSEPRRAGA